VTTSHPWSKWKRRRPGAVLRQSGERVQSHGFVSQTSNACLCGLPLADCEVASRDAYKPGRSLSRSTTEESQ
jgi:hypothetical protein